MSPSGFQGQHKSKRDLFDNEREALRWISAYPNLSTSQFQITQSGLDKGLVDANRSIVESFKSTGFHDFDSQEQGQKYKKILPIYVLGSYGLTKTKISLYRSTNRAATGKVGDPRFWIYEFRTHFPEIWAGGEMICFAQDGIQCLAINLYTMETTKENWEFVTTIFTNSND
tara:strand:+ start:2937 stop:3449 length:513 start_codon:yes stop_codon:yes gene_type:complete